MSLTGFGAKRPSSVAYRMRNKRHGITVTMHRTTRDQAFESLKDFLLGSSGRVVKIYDGLAWKTITTT